MTDEITENPIGRPTVLTDQAILKLEEILRIGGKIVAACAYAKISPQVYYRYLKEDEEFRNRMQSAQHYSIIAARSIVIKQMTSDKVPDEEKTKLAQWWLEKHDIKETPTGPVQNTQVNIFSELKDKYTKPDVVDVQTIPEPLPDDSN